MEKLNKDDLINLIKLIDFERNSIRKESYSNEDINKRYVELGFIRVKLNTQLTILGEPFQ